jgi:adenosylhomocysteine nucleosidase
MASRSEYGPCLQSKINPFMLGIGPVEAGVNLTAELGRLRHEDALPDLVVSLGSAGSKKLREKEIFQVTAVSYRDMDVSLLGYEKGCTPLLDLPAVIELPLKIPGIPGATLSTGGSIVSGDAYDCIEADMVDMETFAVWRACQKFSIPMIGIRGISDGKKDLGQLSDWEKYLHVIDQKLCAAIGALENAVSKGLLLQP